MHIPDPLHPAVVHFPIVLLLFGSILACGAVRWHALAVLAAVALAIGAGGAVFAVETGQKEKRDEIAIPEGQGKEVLRRHERDGVATRNLSLAAAILALAACFLGRVNLPARRFFAVAAAALSLFVAMRIVDTGRTGGELVYYHGVGLRF